MKENTEENKEFGYIRNNNDNSNHVSSTQIPASQQLDMRKEKGEEEGESNQNEKGKAAAEIKTLTTSDAVITQHKQLVSHDHDEAQQKHEQKQLLSLTAAATSTELTNNTSNEKCSRTTEAGIINGTSITPSLPLLCAQTSATSLRNKNEKVAEKAVGSEVLVGNNSVEETQQHEENCDTVVPLNSNSKEAKTSVVLSPSQSTERIVFDSSSSTSSSGNWPHVNGALNMTIKSRIKGDDISSSIETLVPQTTNDCNISDDSTSNASSPLSDNEHSNMVSENEVTTHNDDNHGITSGKNGSASPSHTILSKKASLSSGSSGSPQKDNDLSSLGRNETNDERMMTGSGGEMEEDDDEDLEDGETPMNLSPSLDTKSIRGVIVNKTTKSLNIQQKHQNINNANNSRNGGASESQVEAINLCKNNDSQNVSSSRSSPPIKISSSSSIGLSAKMRLKKQRLAMEAAEAAAAASEAKQINQTQDTRTTSPSVVSNSAYQRAVSMKPKYSSQNEVQQSMDVVMNLSSRAAVSNVSNENRTTTSNNHQENLYNRWADNHHANNDPNEVDSSALHRLAEAAEWKQEEEMMEIEAASTPRGTPPSSNCLSTLSQLRQQPAFQQHQLTMSPTNLPNGLKSTLRENGVVITPQLTSQSEYEVSSSAQGSNYTVTTSPHLSTLNRLPLTKSASNSTSSPDSAIHSASYYSPSQSPVDHNQTNSMVQSQQFRNQQVSGLSSPFSFRATPASSLSRTNSDASQYGSSSITSLPSSVSATTSPISHSHQYSPNNSPCQTRHHSGGGGAGYPQQPLTTGHLSQAHPTAIGPSTSLSQPISNRAQFSLPPGLQGVVLQRQEENGRSSARTVSEYVEGSTQEYLEEKPSGLSAQAGISRQQLINSPCPVCGDKISGFHYGIFSCESCKGFFKRTVQNKKNYVCLRGAQCPISISTRKKCPACRFDKCLKTGMKLEAIREDRTRGGRSTYQCSYTLPNTLPQSGPLPGGAINPGAPITSSTPSSSSCTTSAAFVSGTVSNLNNFNVMNGNGPSSLPLGLNTGSAVTKSEDNMDYSANVQSLARSSWSTNTTPTPPIVELPSSTNLPPNITEGPPPLEQTAPVSLTTKSNVPPLLKEIMDVEHLWFSSRPNDMSGAPPHPSFVRRTLVDNNTADEHMVQTLANMADKRLYKLVKWCKSLPLFKNILIDDQIALLINAWCELLVFSCCYRSVNSPGLIRVSNEKSLDLATAKKFGIEKCIDKMLNFTEQLRRLKVDYYEYVSMKVIVLLTSDASGLKEPEHVRDSQEKVVQGLQQYTTAQYPSLPSKFGELLLRMPELHRVCQVGKEMLCPRQSVNGETPGFNLLMELLRGDH